MDNHANFATALVVTAPSPALSGTSLTVTAGKGARFPAGTFNAVVGPPDATPEELAADHEIIRVTTRVTDGFTVIVRAQEGTSARAIAAGDQIFISATAKLFTDIETFLDQSVRTTASPTFAGLVIAEEADPATLVQIVHTYSGLGEFINVRSDLGIEAQADNSESFYAVDVNTRTYGSSDYTGASYGLFAGVSHGGTGRVTKQYGVLAKAELEVEDGEGTVGRMAGLATQVGNNGGGTVEEMYGLYIPAFANYDQVDVAMGIWVAEQTAGDLNYFLWYDSAAVYRIKGDGVMAYYNPTFAKYTPGAVDYERVVQQWNADVLEYGPEAGGTGVLRKIKLLGAGLIIDNLPTSAAGLATGELWNNGGVLNVA